MLKTRFLGAVGAIIKTRVYVSIGTHDRSVYIILKWIFK